MANGFKFTHAHGACPLVCVCSGTTFALARTTRRMRDLCWTSPQWPPLCRCPNENFIASLSVKFHLKASSSLATSILNTWLTFSLLKSHKSDDPTRASGPGAIKFTTPTRKKSIGDGRNEEVSFFSPIIGALFVYPTALFVCLQCWCQVQKRKTEPTATKNKSLATKMQLKGFHVTIQLLSLFV